MNSEIVSQTPGWYILLCLGLGIALATAFYYKSKIFSRNQKIALALLRGSLVFCVAYLLLNPLIKTVSSIILKPKVVVVVDNSKSMKKGGSINELQKNLKAFTSNISDKGFEVEIADLNAKSIENISEEIFVEKKTNLSSVLNTIRNNYEGQNLSDVVVVSDGIINDGVSPTYSKFSFNIHTVGFGDTTVKKDAFISGVAANKLAYLGNSFMATVDVSSYLLGGLSAYLQIKDSEGTVLAKKEITYKGNESFESVQFELPAKTEGKQRYIAELQVLNGEFSSLNNKKEFIVDIINGKEKILLLAYNPHPDIKAIKSIVDRNGLFELDVKIVSQIDVKTLQKENFDILILHQLPDNDNVHTQFLGQLLSKQKPTFFILGSKSDISYFNGMQNILSISTAGGKFDKVTSKINPSFSMFKIGEAQADLISKLPPLVVPFGSYTLQAGAESILDQYLGNLNTNRSLLAVNLTGTRKMAAFVAEGLWEWRMEEFALSDTQTQIDDLINRTLQLISVKDEKGKLRVYPVVDQFDVEQKIIFAGEAYNEIFERIYGQDVRLKIKSKTGSEKIHEFKITEESSRFEISALPAGVYSYEAEAKILGKNETSKGQFVVTDSDIELQNTQADFDILKTLARENNGDFVLASNFIELRNSLESKGLINKIIAQEELKDLINLRWLLGLILLLASAEWILRKYFGSY